VTLLLTTGCAGSGPTISAGPSSQAPTAASEVTDPSATDPSATNPRTDETTTVQQTSPEFTIITRLPPEGVPELGPISVSDYDEAKLDNLADITPDEPFDSLSIVTAQVSNYGIDDKPKDFRIEAVAETVRSTRLASWS
jgi:hypothetical protein